MKIKTAGLTLAACLLTGCATWSTSSVDESSKDAVQTEAAAPRSAAEVVISDSDILDRKYISLGDISVTVNKTTAFHRDPTPEMVDEKLKAKAAGMGADAVILVQYGQGGVSLWSWGSLEGKGRAVRFIADE